MKTVIDEIELVNFKLSLDPTYGRVELADDPLEKDTGLLTATFEIEGKLVEYQEWYYVSNSSVETVDTLFPDQTSPFAVRLHEYVTKNQDGNDFYAKLNAHIEYEITRLEKVNKFEQALTEINLSQNAFAKRIEFSPQGVIKWKNTGKFPAWVWFTLQGMKTEYGY
jgi:hypothetical protein